MEAPDTRGWVSGEDHYEAVEWEMMMDAFPDSEDGRTLIYEELARYCREYPHYADRLISRAASMWVLENVDADEWEDVSDQREWVEKRLRRKLAAIN